MAAPFAHSRHQAARRASRTVGSALAVGAMLTVLATPEQAAAQPRAPEWMGAVVRGRVPPGAAQRARGALERALLRHGVTVVESGSTDGAALREALADAAQSLEDARAAWREQNAARTVEEARAAVAALARGPLFTDDDGAWVSYREATALQAMALHAMALQATALQDGGQPTEAESAVRALLVTVPLYAPRKEQAPAKFAALVEKVRAELASTPRVALEVRSVPSGATVLVDGRERGLTPLLIEDALPGIHHVAVVGPDGRHTERVRVTEDGARLLARFGGRNMAALRGALDAVRGALTPADFAATIGRASDDALVAVLMPAGKRLDIIAARVSNGVVRTVCGARVADSDNERERATYLLVETLLGGGRDAWVDSGADQDPAGLRAQLFAGRGSLDVPDVVVDETARVSPAAVALGVIAGVAVLGSIATGVGLYAWREARKSDGFTFTVSTEDF